MTQIFLLDERWQQLRKTNYKDTDFFYVEFINLSIWFNLNELLHSCWLLSWKWQKSQQRFVQYPVNCSLMLVNIYDSYEERKWCDMTINVKERVLKQDMNCPIVNVGYWQFFILFNTLSSYFIIDTAKQHVSIAAAGFFVSIYTECIQTQNCCKNNYCKTTQPQGNIDLICIWAEILVPPHQPVVIATTATLVWNSTEAWGKT